MFPKYPLIVWDPVLHDAMPTGFEHAAELAESLCQLPKRASQAMENFARQVEDRFSSPEALAVASDPAADFSMSYANRDIYSHFLGFAEKLKNQRCAAARIFLPRLAPLYAYRGIVEEARSAGLVVLDDQRASNAFASWGCPAYVWLPNDVAYEMNLGQVPWSALIEMLVDNRRYSYPADTNQFLQEWISPFVKLFEGLGFVFDAAVPSRMEAKIESGSVGMVRVYPDIVQRIDLNWKKSSDTWRLGFGVSIECPQVKSITGQFKLLSKGSMLPLVSTSLRSMLGWHAHQRRVSDDKEYIEFHAQVSSTFIMLENVKTLESLDYLINKSVKADTYGLFGSVRGDARSPQGIIGSLVLARLANNPFYEQLATVFRVLVRQNTNSGTSALCFVESECEALIRHLDQGLDGGKEESLYVFNGGGSTLDDVIERWLGVRQSPSLCGLYLLGFTEYLKENYSAHLRNGVCYRFKGEFVDEPRRDWFGISAKEFGGYEYLHGGWINLKIPKEDAQHAVSAVVRSARRFGLTVLHEKTSRISVFLPDGEILPSDKENDWPAIPEDVELDRRESAWARRIDVYDLIYVWLREFLEKQANRGDNLFGWHVDDTQGKKLYRSYSGVTHFLAPFLYPSHGLDHSSVTLSVGISSDAVNEIIKAANLGKGDGRLSVVVRVNDLLEWRGLENMAFTQSRAREIFQCLLQEGLLFLDKVTTIQSLDWLLNSEEMAGFRSRHAFEVERETYYYLCLVTAKLAGNPGYKKLARSMGVQVKKRCAVGRQEQKEVGERWSKLDSYLQEHVSPLHPVQA